MFGYVKPDLPYLYLKDETLYNALYCGQCKSIGKVCGQVARFTLTYDIAFMSAVVHNLLGVDVKIVKQHCIAHWVKKRAVAIPDEISETLACLNLILAYYKVQDDINDNGKGRFLKLFVNPGFKKAVKRYPNLEKIVKDKYKELNDLEREGCDSIDRTAHPFSEMLALLSDEMLKDKKSQESYNFFYNFGKWIYLIDALDDYDKDLKKKNYNPFYSAYKKADYKTLKAETGQEISFIMSATLDGIRENLSKLRFSFNGDLIRNISLRGTMETTKKVLMKEEKDKKANKNKEKK